jgi:hypothetical protein
MTSSTIADLLFASDKGPSHPHASFILPSGAKIVTATGGALRRGGLALYNPQRAPGLAAKGLMWMGLFPGPQVDVRAEPLDELRKVFGDLLGEPRVECAFQFGSTGIYSKTVILVMNPAGRPLAYAKVATLETAKEALQHEASVLNRFSTVAALQGRIPRVLGTPNWRGLSVLVISAGPTRRSPRAFGATHLDFLTRLSNATRVRGLLLDSPMWSMMTRLLAKWSGHISPKWHDRYDWALVQLERQLGQAQIDLIFAHHDFTPWNTRIDPDGNLFVFDWEFSRESSTPAWDFFHFHLASWAAFARPIDRYKIAQLLADAQRKWVEPAENLFLAYLVDVALFHHDAMFREGKQDHRILHAAAKTIDVLRVLRS